MSSKKNARVSEQLEASARSVEEMRQRQQTLEQSQADLLQNMSLLRIIMDNALDPIFLKDRGGRILLANPATLAVVGKDAKDIIGKTDEEFYDDLAVGRMMMAHDRRVMESGVAETIEEIIPSPTGPRTFLSTKTPYRDAQGNVIGLLGIARDITECQEAQEALRASRERLDLALISSQMATFEWDIVNNKRFWSKGVHGLMGTNPETFTGSAEDFFRIMPAEDRGVVQAALTKALETGVYETEYRAVWPNGDIRHVAARGKVHCDEAGRPVWMTGVCWDITESKRREEEIKKLNRTLKALKNSSEAMVHVSSESDYLNQVCQIVVQDCGHAMVWVGFAEEDEGKSVRPVAWAGFEDGYLETLNLTWADTERGRGPTGTAIRAGKPVACRNMLTEPAFAPWREQAIKRGYASSLALPMVADGKVFGAATIYSAKPDPFSEDEIQLLVQLAEDLAYGITTIRLRLAHEQAEEALRASEGLYRAIGESIDYGIWICDAQGRNTYASESFLKLVGITQEQCSAFGWADLLHPDDIEATITAWKQCVQTGGPWYREHRYRGADGQWHPILACGVAVRNEQGEVTAWAGINLDISRIKQAEEALLRSNEELEHRVEERTAELAARAQQLRLLASELTLAEQRERSRLAQVLHDGLQQVLVASRMRLARLERIQEHEVRERTREVDELIAESIEISRSLTAELSPPILREGGLVPGLEWLARWMNDKQGLNVMFDARAQLGPMSEELTVLLFQATRELLFNVVKHAQVKAARVRVEQDGNNIRITVADEGIGFDPARIKQHGAGGGFGLFSIRERLELFGGQFLMLSMPGGGCEIVMNVPLIAPMPSPTVSAPLTTSVAMAKPPEALDSIKANVIRVMLVDDHLVMRQGLKMLIHDNPDMDVIGEASDGHSAVELARQTQPDVILMDISMPGMNGIEATRVIHAEWPKVRIIGLSMFQEEDQAKAMRQAGAEDYLAKSDPSAEMLAAIRRVSGSLSPWFQVED